MKAVRTSLAAWGALAHLAFTCPTYGQASFALDSWITPLVNAPIYDAQGIPLQSPLYLAELWGGTVASSLSPALTLHNARQFAPFGTGIRAGYFGGVQGVVIPSVPLQGWAHLQVRAWDTRLGGTYEEAAARGLGGYGESTIFYAQGGNPTDDLGLPGALIGLQSFNLRPIVPEPSVVWLALAGLPALWWRGKGRWKAKGGR